MLSLPFHSQVAFLACFFGNILTLLIMEVDSAPGAA